MKLGLVGSRIGRDVGKPQISRLKYGSSVSPSSGTPFGYASSRRTVLKKVLPKLTGSPSQVSGAMSRTNCSIFSWYLGSSGWGDWPNTFLSGAGNVLPFILL